MTPEPGFSDPEWWPSPLPKPPERSAPTAWIAIGGILIAAIIAGIVLALFGTRHHGGGSPDSSSGRSLAAFTACLKDQGVLIPSAESNDAMLRPAADACKSHVPALPRSADPVRAAQKALQACLTAAQAKLRSSVGPFSRPSRSGFVQASAICRAESFEQPGGGETPPIQTTSPIA